MPPQREPKSVRRFIVAGHDCRGPRCPGHDATCAFLAEVHKTVGFLRLDRNRFELVLTHGMTVTIESTPDPRVGHVAGKSNEPVALGDEVAGGLERPVEVVKAHLVVALLAIQSNDVVAES